MGLYKQHFLHYFQVKIYFCLEYDVIIQLNVLKNKQLIQWMIFLQVHQEFQQDDLLHSDAMQAQLHQLKKAVCQFLYSLQQDYL